MNVWFTSDTHFGHKRILEYCPESRPFVSLEEHNTKLVENWNAVVKAEDIIYVLGDFFLSNNSLIAEILPQLKGHIRLIRGNHDTNQRCELYLDNGVEEITDFKQLKYKDLNILLCHYPISNDDLAQQILHRRSPRSTNFVWLYGHVHDQAPKGLVNGCFHVGIDTNDCKPVNVDTIYQEWKNQE